MASASSLLPLTSSSLTLSPYSHPLSHHRTSLSRFPPIPNPKPFLRGSLCVARLGFRPEAEFGGEVITDLFQKAEGLLYMIADATVSSSTVTASETVTDAKQSGDWLSGITYTMESVLKVLKNGLSALHVPYSYGFAIILLTILVKAVTFPLTKKQVESAMAMRSLQPQIKAIQQRYAGDQERLQLETARLYKLAGINPLAGCLPTLATIPVWIGLYRALSNVADEGLLTEGFFWIPSLAGPTTIAARQNGSGISWLFPFVDGHPPLGWSDTLAYLVLPVLLVLSQYISVQIMQSSQSNDPNMKSSQALTKFLPLMIGYFALSVPSGLSLYWFTNNILSTTQQLWLQKLGGASDPLKQLNIDALQQEVQKKDTVEQDKVQNGSEFKSTIEPLKEKLTADGLSPGERFKQIKEQEERRKQEREEQKKAAEAVAAAKTQTTDNAHQNEGKVPEMNSHLQSDIINKRNDIHEFNASTRDPSNGGIITDNGPSSSTLNEDGNVEEGDVSMNRQVQRPDDQRR